MGIQELLGYICYKNGLNFHFHFDLLSVLRKNAAAVNYDLIISYEVNIANIRHSTTTARKRKATIDRPFSHS